MDKTPLNAEREVLVNFRLNTEKRDRIKIYARFRNTTMNEVFQRLADQYLETVTEEEMLLADKVMEMERSGNVQ